MLSPFPAVLSVTAAHLSLIFSSSLGSLTSTWIPICILVFCRLKSRHAILAGPTRLTIPWAALVVLIAYPFSSWLSLALFPCAFRMLMDCKKADNYSLVTLETPYRRTFEGSHVDHKSVLKNAVGHPSAEKKWLDLYIEEADRYRSKLVANLR